MARMFSLGGLHAPLLVVRAVLRGGTRLQKDTASAAGSFLCSMESSWGKKTGLFPLVI